MKAERIIRLEKQSACETGELGESFLECDWSWWGRGVWEWSLAPGRGGP